MRTSTDVSVARGNVVLVDHGRRVRGEELGTVAGDGALVPLRGRRVRRAVDYARRALPAAARRSAPLTFPAPLPARCSARRDADRGSAQRRRRLDLDRIPLAAGASRTLFGPPT